jgi:short-subunit dehydrogenase
MVDYSSTKGAIITFTRSMAQQLAPKGIRVNVSRTFSGLVGVCTPPALTVL